MAAKGIMISFLILCVIVGVYIYPFCRVIKEALLDCAQKGLALKDVVWSVMCEDQAVDALLTTLSVSFLSSMFLLVCVTLCLYTFFRSPKSLLSRVSYRIFLLMGALPESIFALSAAGLCLGLNYFLGVELRSSLTVVFLNGLVLLSSGWFILRENVGFVAHKVMASSQDLGASFMRGFLSCVLPLICPALIGVWIVSYMIVADDFLTSLLVSGGDIVNVQSYIYSQTTASCSKIVAFCLCSAAMNFGVTFALYTSSLLAFRKYRIRF